jgi:DNA-binding transcriptional MerR regulator
MVDTALDFAIYSIKAVAHMAGITEPTLRAWEKRYNILTPQRTESGHRRYTKRDIYRVIWLKNRLEEGMSISQASTLLLTQPEKNLDEVLQSEVKQGWSTPGTKRNGHSTGGRQSQGSEIRSLKVLSGELLNAFLEYNEQKADNLLSEAVGLYSPEEICVDIMQPVMREIGERWMRNEVTVATEHFASNMCRTRVNAMIDSLPVVETGPLILTACGPHEFHELGVIVTTFFLRRHGWRVIYLGQNVPALDLEKDLRRLRPSLVVFSAGRTETALNLAQEIAPVINRVRDNWLSNMIFAYAGRAFIEDPGLHDLFKGNLYFGDDARQSIALVERVLGNN